MGRVAARWDVVIEDLLGARYKFKDVDFRKISDGGEAILISRRSEDDITDEDHDTSYELYIDCALPQFTFIDSNSGTFEFQSYISELLTYPDGEIVAKDTCPGGDYCPVGKEHGMGRYLPPKVKGFKPGVYRASLRNYS